MWSRPSILIMRIPTKQTIWTIIQFIMNLLASCTRPRVRKELRWPSPRFQWVSTANKARRSREKKTCSMNWITNHSNHPFRALMSQWEAVSTLVGHFRLLTIFSQTDMKGQVVPTCSICLNQPSQSNLSKFLPCHFLHASAKRRSPTKLPKCKPWKKLRAKSESIRETIWTTSEFPWESANSRTKWECKTLTHHNRTSLSRHKLALRNLDSPSNIILRSWTVPFVSQRHIKVLTDRMLLNGHPDVSNKWRSQRTNLG